MTSRAGQPQGGRDKGCPEGQDPARTPGGDEEGGNDAASPHQSAVPVRGYGVRPTVPAVPLSLRPVAVTGLVSLGLILHSTLLRQDRLRALQGQDGGRCSDLP